MRLARTIVGTLALTLMLNGCGLVLGIVSGESGPPNVKGLKLDLYAKPGSFIDDSYRNGVRKVVFDGDTDLVAVAPDRTTVVTATKPTIFEDPETAVQTVVGIDVATEKRLWKHEIAGIECLSGGWGEVFLCLDYSSKEPGIRIYQTKTGELVHKVSLPTKVAFGSHFGATDDNYYLTVVTRGAAGLDPETVNVLALDRNYQLVWTAERPGRGVEVGGRYRQYCQLIKDHVSCRVHDGEGHPGTGEPDTIFILDALTGKSTMPDVTTLDVQSSNERYLDSFNIDGKTLDYSGKELGARQDVKIIAYPISGFGGEIYYSLPQLVKGVGARGASVIVGGDGIVKYRSDILENWDNQLTNLENDKTFIIPHLTTVSNDGKVLLTRADDTKEDAEYGLVNGTTGEMIYRITEPNMIVSLCDSWVWVASQKDEKSGKWTKSYLLVPNG